MSVFSISFGLCLFKTTNKFHRQWRQEKPNLNMILIVDDKRKISCLLKKILELHKLESEEAYSGEEAQKTLQKNYSLIILDVQMPGMDGFEVAETLAGSSRTRDIPIIFLSAINKEKRYHQRLRVGWGRLHHQTRRSGPVYPKSKDLPQIIPAAK
jgi:CheY-like chemotaxis protein